MNKYNMRKTSTYLCTILLVAPIGMALVQDHNSLNVKSESISSGKLFKRNARPGFRHCYRQPQTDAVKDTAVEDYQLPSVTDDQYGIREVQATPDAQPVNHGAADADALPDTVSDDDPAPDEPEEESSVDDFVPDVEPAPDKPEEESNTADSVPDDEPDLDEPAPGEPKGESSPVYSSAAPQQTPQTNAPAVVNSGTANDISSYAATLKQKPIDWATYADPPSHTDHNDHAKQPAGWSLISEADGRTYKRSVYGSTQGKDILRQDVTVSPLSVNKKMYLEALMKQGASLSELKMVYAIINMETNNADNAQRDYTKSGDLSENVSALNMNIDCLITGGVDIDYQKNGQFHPLATLMNTNSQEGVDATVEAFLKAYRYFGSYEFLNFHRGGSSGWKDGTSHDTKSYRVSAANLIRTLSDDVTDPFYTNDERLE